MIARWGLSYGLSFGILFMLLIILLYGHEKIKFILYALGGSVFALVFAFILPSISFFLLFGGLLMYDTFVVRNGVTVPLKSRFFRLLTVGERSTVLPLSYHLFPLLLLVQLLYLHPAFGIVVGILFLIGLSRPFTSFRQTIQIYALTLFLPYSLAILFYMYAS